MIITTSEEIYKLTGSYDLGNDFSAIESDIKEQTRELKKYIGQDCYNHVRELYKKETKSESDKEIIHLTQRPIALLATLSYFRSNIVGHSDTGRITSVDKDNGQVAYEWMLERDDREREKKAFSAIDTLLRYLIDNKVESFISSTQYEAVSSLMVGNIDVFQEHFNIDDSYRFFFVLEPLLRRSQERFIKPLLGDRYEDVKDGTDDVGRAQLSLCQNIIVMQTISEALYRYSPKLFPEGLMYQIATDGNKLSIADENKVTLLRESLKKEELQSVELLRRTLEEKKRDPFIMPGNSASNKFFRT